MKRLFQLIISAILAIRCQYYRIATYSRVLATRKFFGASLVLIFAIAISALLGQQIVSDPIIPIALLFAIIYIVIIIIKPFESFLIWIVVAPLFEQRFTFGNIITFNRVALSLLLFATILRKFAFSKGRGKIGVLDGAIVLFILMSITNLLLTRPETSSLASAFNISYLKDNKDVWYSFEGHYFFAFVTFYIARNLIDDKRKMLLTMAAIVSLFFYLVPIGIFEHFTGHTWFTRSETLTYADANRAAGPFENPAVYGYVLGIGFVFAIHLCLQAKEPLKKAFLLIVIAAICVGEAMTFTRSAWLSPIAAYLTLMLLYKGKRKVLLASFCVALVALVIAFPAIKNSPMYTKRITSQSELDSRIYVAHVQMQMFKAKPLFGHGLWNFDYYKYKYPVRINGIDSGRIRTTSHNTFITLLVETGILGLSLYATVLGIILWKWLKAFKLASKRSDTYTKQLLATVGAATLCYFATAFVIDFKHFMYAEYLLWILFAMITQLHWETVEQPQTYESVDQNTLSSQAIEHTALSSVI